MKKWLIILVLLLIGYYVSQNVDSWREKWESIVFEEDKKKLEEENPSYTYKSSIDKLKSLKEKDKNQSEEPNITQEKTKNEEKEAEKKAEEEIAKLVGVKPTPKEETIIEKVEKYIKMIKEKIFGGNQWQSLSLIP